LLGVARRGLSLYRVEVSIGCKVCLPFHLRVPCFLTQERAKLIENGFILMRDVSSNSGSANTGAPSWLSRTPPEIRKLDQPELLDFCGGCTTLDRSFLGLFDELLESGVFANLFVDPVLVLLRMLEE
jgi:hypothetical protein